MRNRDNVTHVVVLTTVASAEEAESLVRRLVADRLIACGTILNNARSIYTWKGELEETSESLVILKTQQGCWDELRATVEKLHPYQVPELLAVPVEAGLPAYLEWVVEQTGEVPQ
ncbi:MAG: divalent-cation tolerance protein CutA [Gemmatimonadota bacterium]|nr:MAG: divalent-cation tolerance protein CutA [Gemmatimonadota bacterium]